MSSRSRTENEFSQRTKNHLAERAGFKCSKPECRRPTSGPSLEGPEAVGRIGVAAHIKAASPEGKRYDAAMTSEERKDFSNGIWLCQTDSRLIDTDEAQFPVELLNDWKRLAEERALQELNSGVILVPSAVVKTGDIDEVFKKLLESAKADSKTFHRSSAWPACPVSLRLVLKNGDHNQDLTASDLASSMKVFDELSVVASPGTGKTTTLLQIADFALAAENFVAIYVPLSEWDIGDGGLFPSILKRPAFRNYQEADLTLLAEKGRLAFMLDAWNELDDVAKKNVRNEIKKIKRNFPALCVVISSRTGDADLPIGGPVVEVGSLTESQQLEIAKSIRPEDGEKVIEHARRTPGLRDLIGIPLYLTSLLQYKGGAPLPETKEQILRLFVESAESEPAKRTILRDELQDRHRDYLESIAVEATRLRTTALSETQIRAVVNVVQTRLKENNQIAELVAPMKIVDALVNSHLIVRSSTGMLSCQHQQFQEWFASLYVERLIASSLGSEADRKAMREEILNIPFWKEAILFACERLSAAGEKGAEAVASVTIETMGIDPLLSAEMIWRSSGKAWQFSKDFVVSFVKKWHLAGKIDRGFRFMILSGRPEFSEFVWPLVADPNDQVHLDALRSAYPFRIAVLGPDILKKFAELSEATRKNVIYEIASNGFMDGIALAVSLGVSDSSAKVKASAIEALVFRKANGSILQVLKGATSEVYQELAKDWYPGTFADADIEAQVELEAKKIQAEKADPAFDLRSILRANVRDVSQEAEVQKLIEQIDFKKDADQLIHRLYQLYPDAVIKALLSRLEKGKVVPYLTYEILKKSPAIAEEGPLLDQLIKNENEVIAAIAGPVAIGILIDQYLDVHRKIVAFGKYNETLNGQRQSLVQRISRTKPDPFATALLRNADADDPSEIAALADLVYRHGYRNNDEPIIFSDENHSAIVKLINDWGSRLIASSKATRAEMATIAMAAQRLPTQALASILVSLLLKDVTMYKKAREEYQKARKEGAHYEGDGSTSWTEQYKRSFIAIKGDVTVDAMKGFLREPEFCKEAAIVLKMIWKSSEPSVSSSKGFSASPDFSLVPAAFVMRQRKVEPHPYAVEILNVLKGFIKSGSSVEDHKRAIQLATIALNMPCEAEDSLISELLKLSHDHYAKCELLTTVALSGRVLSSEVVLNGIEEFLTEAKSKTWLMDDGGSRLKDWIKLLAFTEKPSVIISALDKVGGIDRTPSGLRGILYALTYSHSMEAETVLSELATRDSRMVCEYDWYIALLRRRTLTAARIFLNHLNNNFKCSGDIGGLSTTLSTMIASYPEFRAEIYAQFEKLASGPSKALFLSAISRVADVECVLFLIRNSIAYKIPFQDIAWAIRGCVTERNSTGGRLSESKLSQLRKELFAVATGAKTDDAEVAKKGLVLVDDILDEYNDIEIEYRHPDISKGIPWPQVEGIAKK